MKNLIIAGMFLLAASAFALADQSPEEKIAQLEKTIEAQRRTISRAEKMVANLKKQLAEQEKENNRLLALCRKAGIDTAKPRQQNAPNINSQNGQAKHIEAPLEIGQVVYFDYDKYTDCFQIQQIIDAQNMIIELRIRELVGDTYESYHQPVWLRGFDTSKYVDNTIIRPASDQLFKVTGTQQYITAIGGTKTLFVLEPFISQEQK